jgi:hypothetical protein
MVRHHHDDVCVEFAAPPSPEEIQQAVIFPRGENRDPLALRCV